MPAQLISTMLSLKYILLFTIIFSYLVNLMISSGFFIIILFCNVWQVQGHVRLTFPPARTYALDFLDNAHTEAPCGFPSSSGEFLVDVMKF